MLEVEQLDSKSILLILDVTALFDESNLAAGKISSFASKPQGSNLFLLVFWLGSWSQFRKQVIEILPAFMGIFEEFPVPVVTEVLLVDVNASLLATDADAYSMFDNLGCSFGLDRIDVVSCGLGVADEDNFLV